MSLKSVLTVLVLLFTLANNAIADESSALANAKIYSTADRVIQSDTITLLTLNMAHGRKDRLNQIFLSSDTIRKNLDNIADRLLQLDADVVALQEADGPSFWSGNFDHVGYLAQAAGYPMSVRSDHVESWLINFGTGILSRVAFKEVISHDFPRSPPTLRKGFTLAQIDWQPDESKSPIAIDVLSVHLDFSRKKVREQQIKDMLRIMKKRNNPVIILGDFNSEWPSSESVIRKLAECGGSKVYKPDATDLGTYKSGKYRLDWVLLSDDLEFKRYEVLKDVLSDHQSIVVEVAYLGDREQKMAAANKNSADCDEPISENKPVD